MKAKTFLELVSLSATLYTISKETKLMEKLAELSEEGKDKINDFMKERMIDENGNEMEFIDKLMLKAHEAKEELEARIGEVVATFYEKVNIAHTDKITSLEAEIEQLKKELALLEAKFNQQSKN